MFIRIYVLYIYAFGLFEHVKFQFYSQTHTVLGKASSDQAAHSNTSASRPTGFEIRVGFVREEMVTRIGLRFFLGSDDEACVGVIIFDDVVSINLMIAWLTVFLKEYSFPISFQDCQKQQDGEKDRHEVLHRQKDSKHLK
ncbi:hypothetical protein V6N11_070038 [Hibiscus sabdariffa]|uniref:Uncharacterized protein n=1 Tax=Hibiscus sabdariffa TaxID=183260 RepID=A0ABR2QDV5_9ROSI